MSNVVPISQARAVADLKRAARAGSGDAAQLLALRQERRRPIADDSAIQPDFYRMGLEDELEAWERSKQHPWTHRARRWLCERLYELADWAGR